MLEAAFSFFYSLDPWIVIAILAATPFGEARASIIYGLAQGLDPVSVLMLSLALNIVVVLPILFFLRQKPVMDLIHKLIGRRITMLVEKNREKFEIYEELALFGFVAVPVVGTGAWTGALLSTVLGLEPKKSFVVIAAGVVAAGIIVFFGMNGIMYIMK